MKYSLFITCWLFLFMQDAIAADKVTSHILVNDSKSWDGGVFEYPEGKPKITIQKIDVKTNGKELSLVIHCHTMPLAAYVLKGSVKVIKTSGEDRLFKAGDAFIEVVETWHKGTFTEDTELIVFYAGKVGVPLSIKPEGVAKLSTPCK